MVREERGSALLLVLFMIMIFTMLGIAVAGAALGGAKLAAKRESDVQTVHLAEKALNIAVAYIGSYYNAQEELEMSREKLLADLPRLNDALSNVGAPTNLDEETTPGSHGTIQSVGLCARKELCLLITAQAEVNGVQRTVSQEVELSTYPEFLDYVLGSQGDVRINGAPYVLGNIYAGGKLQVRNHAEYYYNDEGMKEAEAHYPFVKGTAYVQDPATDVMYCEKNCSSTDFVVVDDGKLDEKLGTESSIGIRSRKKFVPIDFEATFLDKLAEAVNGDKTLRNQIKAAYDRNKLLDSKEDVIDILKQRQDAIKVVSQVQPLASQYADKEEYAVAKQAFLEELDINNPITLDRSILFDGNLRLDGTEYGMLQYTAKEWADTKQSGSKWIIINGDLTIASDINTEAWLPVKANILVMGTLTISGKVGVDSTIFTLGDSQTEISDAQIKGLNDKELLLFSNAPILITRVNSFKPISEAYVPEDSGLAPTQDMINYQLDAFFYTEQRAELYGVGSIFWIRGGFFAKEGLVLNAVIGNTTENDLQTVMTLPDSPKETILLEDKVKKSRLILEYKDELIANQMSALPRVNKMEIKIGNRKLE